MPAQPESTCILDDDASVRNSIEQLLDSDGLKAQSFEGAEDFLAHARSHSVPRWARGFHHWRTADSHTDDHGRPGRRQCWYPTPSHDHSAGAEVDGLRDRAVRQESPGRSEGRLVRMPFHREQLKILPFAPSFTRCCATSLVIG
jgi:hypothetical protein